MDKQIKKSKAKKKFQACRMSGRPVEPEAVERYSDKWKAYFDLVQEHYAQDMEKVHLLLERYERLLLKQFDIITEWEELRSEKDWSKALDKYGPIMVAKELDTEKILYIIADQLG